MKISSVKLSTVVAVFVGAVLVASCQSESEIPPEFSGAAAMRHIERQCAFGPRVPGSVARDSAATYIAKTLKRYGASVSLQTFDMPDPYGDGRLNMINVIGSFYPDREDRVMLCAHYDSRPRADQEEDSTLAVLPVPGANDGASGVAVLLEFGRLLSAARPAKIGVDLVFFDGEDYGKEGDLEYYLLGSKYFAVNIEGYRPLCAVLLDMVGGKGTQIAKESNSLENARELTEHLFAIAARLELDFFVDRPGPPIIDDHIPLLRAGIDAVDLIGYDYAHWHTVRDTPDKCDPALLAQVGRLLVDFVYAYNYEGRKR